MSELGKLLKGLRNKKSLRSVAEKTGLSHSYIADIEKGFRRGTKAPLNPSPDTLKRLAKAYDYPYEKLMIAAGYMERDTGKKQSDLYSKMPEFTEKDERDIAKELENMIYNLSSNEGYSQFDGKDMNEIDEEDRELLISSLENSLRLAKRITKQKVPPRKHRE